MKILFVSRDYYPTLGGIQSHVEKLSSAMVELGHDVEIFTIGMGLGGSGLEERRCGKKVLRVATTNVRYLRGLQYLFKGLYALKSVLSNDRWDVVHWHDCYFDSLLTKIAPHRVVRVFTNHSGVFLTANPGGLWARYLKWSIRHADAVITPSKELAEKTAAIAQPQRIFYIANGADIQQFAPRGHNQQVREKYKAGNNHFVVLCPRRLEPKNGVFYLVKAARHLPLEVRRKTKILIVGGGFPEERAKMDTYIAAERLGDIIVFAGPVKNEDMHQYYDASDAVVLPSLMEATSISGLEAMASGKPLIGTKVGGIPELIEHGRDGLLVEPASPEALANAIAWLFHSPELRVRMGRVAREKAVSVFSWRSIAERTLAVYRLVAESKSQRR